jgi:hypothetical protein
VEHYIRQNLLQAVVERPELGNSSSS